MPNQIESPEILTKGIVELATPIPKIEGKSRQYLNGKSTFGTKR